MALKKARVSHRRALVLGATGHIGNAIVRELLSQGWVVTAICRRKVLAANLVGLPVRVLFGDLDLSDQLDGWIKGHDAVIDAAAPYPFRLLNTMNEREKNLLDYATRRTDALLDVVQKHNVRLAYVSSFTTLLRHQLSFDRWQTQVVRSLHPYFAVKDLIEARVLAAAQEGLPVVIINPTMCLGPWELKPREICLVPRLLRNEIPIGAPHILNVIDVRDLAKGLVAALREERYGEPILFSGHNISSDELFAWICRLGGARPPRFSVSASLSAFASYWFELAFASFGQSSPLPSLAVALLCEHQWLAPSATQCELGVFPRPLSETLRDAITWYRQIGYC